MFIRRAVLIALWIVALFPAAGLYAQAWAAKMFKDTTHDFGVVSRNSKTEFVFEIENVYEEDVHIASVRSSCGCTAPKILHDTIKTWEKGGILAEFNTRSFIGAKTAAITVVIDRPYYAEVQLLVMGKIRSDIVTEPGEVNFGAVSIGEEKQQRVKISYAGRSDWKITDVRGNSNNLEVRIGGVERRGNVTNYLLDIKLLPLDKATNLQDDLVIVTNDPVNDRFTLPVNGRIQSAIEVAPAIVDLGPIPANGEAMQRFVVKGNEPFTITNIQSADARLQFAHDAEKKKVHVVVVKATQGAATDNINCDIQVKNDLAPMTASVVKVVGQMQR